MFPEKPLTQPMSPEKPPKLLDAILLNKYLAGAVTFTEQQATNANCDQTDGTETVGEEDTTALIRFVLNMEGYQNLPHIDSNN